MIDWLIKLLVNYKYKKEHFLAWTWKIDEHTDIVILDGSKVIYMAKSEDCECRK